MEHWAVEMENGVIQGIRRHRALEKELGKEISFKKATGHPQSSKLTNYNVSHE